LVPGKGNIERTRFILNQMCQHHWNYDFEVPKFRWASYNDQFALNNRTKLVAVIALHKQML